MTKQIEDKDVSNLLEHTIDSFSTTGKQHVGLPLGNLTSQLLVNVYMNELDQFMKRTLKAEHYIRFADDFVILHDDRDHLLKMIPQISEFLETRLKLTLHPNKLFLRSFTSGVDFLGWVHFPHQRVLRTSTKRRMFKNVRISDADETVVGSYCGLLSHGNGWKLIQEITSDSLDFLAKIGDNR